MFAFLQKLWVSLLMSPIICRIFQFFFNLGVTLFIPFRKPEVIEGSNCIGENDCVAKILIKRNVSSVLLVTDKTLTGLHLTDTLVQSLSKNNIKYTLYDDTLVNPTIDNVEDALKLYHANECKAIIGFGGGSPMDCAKGVGVRVARPRTSITKMRGLLRVLWPLPPIIAIPTTAGTGSEVTVAAVIKDAKTHEKYSISDPFLIPNHVVLDPLLTVKCPPHITSTVGMDTLTHAVESYLNHWNTRDTNKKQIEAVQLVFTHLFTAYTTGTNIEARSKMQRAAFLGGYAFTRKFVGNVHAIAHQLGGLYNTPHGLANAVLLPIVLEYFGKDAHKSLARLAAITTYKGAVVKGAGDSDAVAAGKFIEAIRDLNKSMNIPTTLEGIKDEDIPLLAERAALEANPVYPVPRVFTFKDFEACIRKVKG